jgi:PST family polysaccharide transporter
VANVNWRELAAFGANLTGQNLTTYCIRILDQVTVGLASGAAALGIYGRGAQVAALPVQFGLGPFNPWIVATLGLKHETPAAHVAFFGAALNSLLHVSLISAAVCVALPDRLLLVLFGDGWLQAVPVVRWLGVALAVQPLLNAPVWLLSACGEVRRLLVWSLSGLVLMLLGCAAAYRHGPGAIALAAALAAVAHAGIGPVFCRDRTAVVASDWFKASFVPLAVHGGFTAVLLVADQQVAAMRSAVAHFAVPVGIAVGYYGLMLLLCPPFRRELLNHVFWSR